ncbi:fatty acid desaturase [Rhizobium sp. CFBP 8762]|uniref:fatty acid desaturase n=1 Tax=Rhizobium sp. CFBP 8762 TaxID=2775279 RepID=UPI00177B8AC0|nr:fatty acid desaturase [Rhizobium sp. CFBP 8762]MBD8554040.1 fatty acid desaturase [Rhizobium sp. CFBP 8762]
MGRPARYTLFSTRVEHRIEWPTVFLAVFIYGGFLSVTFWWAALPLPLVVALGGWLVAWQGSLQHEVIHNHPTRIQSLNDAIGFAPLSLWLPYRIYRDSHLIHHHDEHLTDPIEDPESSYVTLAAWEKLGLIGRTLANWNMTLLGRLTIGPAVMILSFLVSEYHLIRHGEPGQLKKWLWHLAGVAVVLVWVLLICDMPLWLYIFGFVYLGASLTRLRSFAEHKYSESHEERTAIVENSRVLGLLYLHNNLHVLHHLRPGISWYNLPMVYRSHRDDLVARNGGLVYNGYSDVIRRFLVKPHDQPVHPTQSSSHSLDEAVTPNEHADMRLV